MAIDALGDQPRANLGFKELQLVDACLAAPRTLSIAAPPRSYTDDLLGVINEFRATYPDVRLVMREVFESLGNEMLEAGEVDLVIGDNKCCRNPEELLVEKMYEIEPMVIMPVGHPLADRRRITEDPTLRAFIDLAKERLGRYGSVGICASTCLHHSASIVFRARNSKESRGDTIRREMRSGVLIYFAAVGATLFFK
ncbi:LysR family transcriptional regulator substrate-binding protein [Blastopirellula retiformator]|uniref:Transcriptional regulator CysB-like protein n=1 Tax=Blastopirellula retiformator TaxID=2527970 RepID=A0A5C5VA60_9BACT|nr:LysR family transcriptional regulator substrate-binding protein [Blastopirellula retiformator]TWT34860.1 transcriptional regulator CysB-like protein [Blastopirellula retiformator]